MASWMTPVHRTTVQIARDTLALMEEEGLGVLEAVSQASGGAVTSAETLYLRMADVIRATPGHLNLGKTILKSFGQTARALGPPLADSAPAAAEAADLVMKVSAPAMAEAGGGLLGMLATVGGWLGIGGTAATVVGAALVTAALAGITYEAANFLGSHAGDEPVHAGSRTHQGGPNVAPVDPKPKAQSDRYYIYAVNTSGWSFYIGRPSDVEGRAANSFTDGGTGNQPIESKKLVAQAFGSPDEARAYLKARISPGHQSRWTGAWVKFEGSEYRTVHVGL